MDRLAEEGDRYGPDGLSSGDSQLETGRDATLSGARSDFDDLRGDASGDLAATSRVTAADLQAETTSVLLENDGLQAEGVIGMPHEQKEATMVPNEGKSRVKGTE